MNGLTKQYRNIQHFEIRFVTLQISDFFKYRFMKKRVFICGVAMLMIGLASCKSSSDTTNSSTEAVVDIHDNKSLDWIGSYSGTIPCADCIGIQLNLRLSEDGTYVLKEKYLGKEDNSFDTSGKVVWDKNKHIITIGEGKETMKFTVGSNMLTLLDTEGNRITGEFADMYNLAKVDMGLVEKYWKLTELYGVPIVTPENGKEAHMILNIDGNRVHGNSGCNTFSGTYDLKPGNRLSFSKMVLTRMMCIQGIEIETKMNQAFEATESYAVSGDSLMLNGSGKASLARFIAVYMK